MTDWTDISDIDRHHGAAFEAISMHAWCSLHAPNKQAKHAVCLPNHLINVLGKGELVTQNHSKVANLLTTLKPVIAQSIGRGERRLAKSKRYNLALGRIQFQTFSQRTPALQNRASSLQRSALLCREGLLSAKDSLREAKRGFHFQEICSFQEEDIRCL